MADGNDVDSRPDEAGESLDSFKAALDDADTKGMDGHHARHGIHWDPVTDAGGAAPTPSDSSSEFHFDLGGALARLSGTPSTTPRADAVAPPIDAAPPPAESAAPPAPPVPAPERPGPVAPEADPVPPPPVPAPTPPSPTPPAPTPPPPVAPSSDVPAAPTDLPVRGPAVDDATRDPLQAVRGLIDDGSKPRRMPQSTWGSVFDDTDTAPAARDGAEPLPEIREATTTELPTRSRMVAPGSVFDDAAPQAASAPTLPSAPAPAPTPAPVPSGPASPAPETAAVLPTLPAAPAKVAPIITEPPASATATPDLHALRSAQLRADRNLRKSKLFSRSFLAIVLMAAVVALALVFGRSYLFPTEWDATLTPVVDEIQEARGDDFESTVPLEVLPAEQYAERVVAATIGSDWVEDLPVWRAAGLADGNATAESVGAALASRFPVVYDASADTIYQLDGASDALVARELRIVLDDVYEIQRGGVVATRAERAEPALSGVSGTDYIAHRAVDVHASGGRPAVAEGDEALALPLPIQYELDAIDLLGEAVLVGAGFDPSSAARGIAYPDPLATVLDDRAVRTAGGLLRPGEQALTDPLALGVDDWSLVWGAHLPTTTVDRLVDIVTADSFRLIDRGGSTCFIGVFQTANDDDGTQLLSSMLRWVGSASAGSQALATQLGTTRVQLEACDPGTAATGPTEPSPVADVITRQITRLAR